ncbi:MAG: cyclopropane-fatty-acyl-phospholipid synthase family protein, partial [Gammaproteobacteria bacterium]
MKSATLCIDKADLQDRNPGLLDSVARRILHSRLENLRHGELILAEGDEHYRFGRQDDMFPRTVTINITDSGFYSSLLVYGSVGFGDAYLNDCWQCDDLTGLFELFLCNRNYIENIGPGMRWLVKPLQLLRGYLHRNTLQGSRRNIEAHYDLGNALFELFLDKTMMYSCGIFDRPESSLQAASEAKLERICRKLQLQPSDHVLEIGTGWGGFALYAAQHYGCCVTTTTISRQQYEYAKQRVQAAGLEDRITLLFDDYRKLDGSYDKLVSIEMIEAIGHQYFDTYFRKCSELLKP